MSDLEVAVQHTANGGINAQEVAALGAILASHGLTGRQVEGLVVRLQKIGVQVALAAMPEVLEDIRRIQESRIWELINLVGALPTWGGYVNKQQVVQIITTVASRTPRQ